ncbi:unnamed protein product [Rotaria sp. Silwood1]|nr:unnamed protein product [Rotaria sp. Silwood1]CAF5126188.1 unnamed protein product [Rotaria sp. Silwood1]
MPHEKLIPKTINHLSANCSTLNIIGEIPLEINVNGIKTTIIADVTTNLVTNLILGSDWIQANNVYILTPEQRLMIRSRVPPATTRTITLTTPTIIQTTPAITSTNITNILEDELIELLKPKFNKKEDAPRQSNYEQEELIITTTEQEMNEFDSNEQQLQQ